MARYLEDIEVTNMSEVDGYVWIDHETGKKWSIPLQFAGLIAPTLMMLPPRPETEADRAVRREELKASIEFAKQRNNPAVVTELQKVLERLEQGEKLWEPDTSIRPRIPKHSGEARG